MDSRQEKSLIYLSYSWPPVGNPASLRGWHLARNLVDLGWAVELFSSHSLTYRHRDFVPRENVCPRLRVTRTFSANFAFPGFLRRLLVAGDHVDPEWTWERPTRRAIEARLPAIGSPMLYSSSYPYTSHFIARHFKEKYGFPWVAELLDPWVGNFEGETRARALTWEREILTAADRIVVINREMVDVVAKGDELIARKTLVIPDGYNEADFADLAPHPAGSVRPCLLYSGTLYRAYEPAARSLASLWKRLTGGSLALLGSGTRAARRCRLVGDAGVDLLPRMPVYEARRYEAGADFFLLITPPATRYVSTSKLYQYLRLGKPIVLVGSPEGAVPRTLSECGAPHIVLSYGEEAIWEEKLRQWLATRPASTELSPNVRTFEWRTLAEKLDAALSEVRILATP